MGGRGSRGCGRGGGAPGGRASHSHRSGGRPPRGPALRARAGWGCACVWGGEGLPAGHFGGRCCPFGWGGHLGHFRPMGSNELDSQEWRSHSSRDADSGRHPHPFVSGSAAAHGHRGYLPSRFPPPNLPRVPCGATVGTRTCAGQKAPRKDARRGALRYRRGD